MTSSTRAEGCPALPHSVDLVDPGLYSDGDAHAVWRELRRDRPVAWHPVDAHRGFWSVTRHGDAEHVLRDHAAFTSQRGTLLDLLGVDDPAGGHQMVVTDPPRHSAMREPVQRALSLRRMERHQDLVRSRVRRLLRPLEDGEIDFAAAALDLPMAAIGVLMRLPETDWDWLTRTATTCVAPDDPEYGHPRGREHALRTAHRQLFGYFQDLVRERLRDPGEGDDLVSLLLRTELDGRRMTQDEIVSNCYSILLGATATTPHSPSVALGELVGTPVLQDWAARPELLNSGVEEALRWASPVNHLLRYATRDVTVGGIPVEAGQAVVVWLGSANRDEDVFDDPFVFDIRRRPNRHLAFGAGPHYCVGHTLARVTIRLLFEELFTRFTDFAAAGPPSRLRSNFVAGLKHLPITARVVPGTRPL